MRVTCTVIPEYRNDSTAGNPEETGFLPQSAYPKRPATDKLQSKQGAIFLHHLSRRSLCAGILAAGVSPVAGVDYDRPVPEAEGLTSYRYGNFTTVRWNNRLLCTYRTDPGGKYPYFSPLSGPATGAPLTSESALPYPHHRGLWVGLDPLNGGDYWGDSPLARGQIRSAGVDTPRPGTIRDRCEWVRPDAPSPMEDERRFTAAVAEPGRLWTLDAEIVLRAREDLVVKSAKHSLFALRAAPDLAPIYGGSMFNAEGGRNAGGVHGKASAWAGYCAVRNGVTEGIAIFDHPSNPWSPCPWMARDYGHLSPSPLGFLDKPWRLARGASLRLRYRVVAFAGTPAEAGLAKLYSTWSADHIGTER
jgi:hypothetical protein